MTTSSTSAPRLRDRLREETGRAILVAAEEVFSEDGLHAARMERIASRAGVAVGTLYNHFADKETLLGALTSLRRERLFARVDAALAGCEGRPVAEQLRVFLDAFIEHARAHGRFLAALVQAGEGPAKLRTSTLLDGLLERAERLVARGVASGELRADEHRMFAVGVIGMTRLAVVSAVEGRGTLDAIVPGVVDLFLRGARP